ncbi:MULTISPECIES: hypothetical protein [Bacillus]|nr:MULTISPECIES: hypothetical protein [Bacillus]
MRADTKLESTNDILEVLLYAYQQGTEDHNISAKELVDEIGKKLKEIYK